ncbi:hypothetical protein CWG72_10230 [Salmonella enterica subsp. enterica serovar Carmel]|nr:hypothetical protein [Salmonella enterica subsp. enterica serovar Apapa]EDI0281235.1 hypothetical protein [Salmonella enterica subsp. enterica serovar Tennessee]EDI0705478.1 hypothetical protein [Salmonella enterica subsp. enterica serovar Oranienburg]EDI5264995.1 hypothetical protein [Salmonella enterica]EDL5692098.1 hypothetical protein [Salmonella enterica subsp. enterica serovar Carmel]EDL7319116.1 hypothetical protein [Salmonella enterica subsp. enterica serovar Muenchen]
MVWRQFVDLRRHLTCSYRLNIGQMLAAILVIRFQNFRQSFPFCWLKEKNFTVHSLLRHPANRQRQILHRPVHSFLNFIHWLAVNVHIINGVCISFVTGAGCGVGSGFGIGNGGTGGIAGIGDTGSVFITLFLIVCISTSRVRLCRRQQPAFTVFCEFVAVTERSIKNPLSGHIINNQMIHSDRLKEIASFEASFFNSQCRQGVNLILIVVIKPDSPCDNTSQFLYGLFGIKDHLFNIFHFAISSS